MINKMTRKSAILALALACSSPLAVMAEGPTSRPTMYQGEKGDRGTERPDKPARPNRPNQGARPPVTPEQWEQVQSFMREYSPRRMAELEGMSVAADDRRANFLKQLISAQYDYVMSLKSEDSELYELQLSKVKTQDAIYGMLRDVKKGAVMPEDQKKEFRGLVAKLVEVNLSERERRIVRARESLTRAQTTLEEDKKHKDAMIAERMEQFLREGIRPFKMDGEKERRNPDEPGAMKDPTLRDVLSAADAAAIEPSATRAR